MNKFIHLLITSLAFLIIPLGFFFGFTTYPHYAAYVLEGYLSILLPIVLITLLIKNYLVLTLNYSRKPKQPKVKHSQNNQSIEVRAYSVIKRLLGKFPQTRYFSTSSLLSLVSAIMF